MNSQDVPSEEKILKEELFSYFSELDKTLDVDRKISITIMGGIGLNLLGVYRPTDDVDILLSVEDEKYIKTIEDTGKSKDLLVHVMCEKSEHKD